MNTNSPWMYMHEDDDEHIYYEDDTKEPLAPHHNVLTFGKYQQKHLGEIDDVSYLEWLKKVATEKDDWFLLKTVNLRLDELS
jgi:hypothetical protein